MPTLNEVYAVARQMPPPDRLRLAALLLEDVTQSLPVVDSTTPEGYSDVWTEEDIRDATAHSLAYATKLYGDEDDLLPVVSGTEKARV